MAQAYKTTCKFVLVLALVLMTSMGESRSLSGTEKQDATLVCNSVHGTESGETCTSVAQDFNLSLQDFLAINPNINCDSVFVGQWLCVFGSA